jgi:hypothetical protein
MNPYIKDVFEVVGWIIGMVGGVIGLVSGVIGLYKLVAENRLARGQRESELRWRKATAANDLLSHFYADPVFRSAMMMLDHDNRPFEIAPNSEVTISRADIWAALARPPAPFDAKNRFIRTAMDRMFEAFDRIGHSIHIRVLTSDDIQYALEFYIAVLAQRRSVVELYMKELGFEQALRFFNASRAWNPAARAA